LQRESAANYFFSLHSLLFSENISRKNSFSGVNLSSFIYSLTVFLSVSGTIEVSGPELFFCQIWEVLKIIYQLILKGI